MIKLFNDEVMSHYLAYCFQENEPNPALFFLGTDQECAYGYKVNERDDQKNLVDMFVQLLQQANVKGGNVDVTVDQCETSTDNEQPVTD